MAIGTLAATVASLCFASAAIWAGVMDLATMKIRNGTVLFLLAVYAALAPIAGIDSQEIGASVLFATLVLFLMLALFAMKWIGGGDAKFAAVLALWLGPEHGTAFLIMTAIFGGLLTLAILQFRSMTLPLQCIGVSWIDRLHRRDSGIPYGVAIASGALYIFPKTAWMVASLS